jgi:ribosomal-protein-alanine N-acetyltransferase
MQNNYRTPRLLIDQLTRGDAGFILELVNTAEWLKFIGERNVGSIKEAIKYIQKIIDNPHTNYWVVKKQEQQIPIGIVTFIKRSYLDHYDIGFAFLPGHCKQGYAYEATTAIVKDLKDSVHTKILATTVKENVNSMKLLKKLGFRFIREMEHETEILLVYSVTTNNK